MQAIREIVAHLFVAACIVAVVMACGVVAAGEGLCGSKE